MHLSRWPLTTADLRPGAAGKHHLPDLPTQQSSEWSVTVLVSQPRTMGPTGMPNLPAVTQLTHVSEPVSGGA